MRFRIRGTPRRELPDSARPGKPDRSVITRPSRWRPDLGRLSSGLPKSSNHWKLTIEKVPMVGIFWTRFFQSLEFLDYDYDYELFPEPPLPP